MSVSQNGNRFQEILNSKAFRKMTFTFFKHLWWLINFCNSGENMELEYFEVINVILFVVHPACRHLIHGSYIMSSLCFVCICLLHVGTNVYKYIIMHWYKLDLSNKYNELHCGCSI